MRHSGKYLLPLLLLLLLFCAGSVRGQSYSVGTNLPALARATLSAEAGMALDRKWSLHLPVYYHPFVGKQTKRRQHFTLLPGVRYWLLESFTGGFVGLHAIGSTYHIAHRQSRYEGTAYGMGISLGYARLLSPRWNLELEGGISGVWADYTEYECGRCTRRKGKYTRAMVVPGKIALSLIYLF